MTSKLRASIPKGVRIYAIGDIHGRADLLTKAFDRIDTDLEAHPTTRPIEVYIGDYVDRGPSSAYVLDLLIWRSQVRETVFLLGNHEVFMRDFINNPEVLSDWQQYGGLETLMSYGLRPSLSPGGREQVELLSVLQTRLPNTHRAFLESLSLSFTCGGFFFVHAGVRPGVPLDKQREEDMLWIREEFLLHTGRFDKIIVHGHTPVMQPEIHPNRINIDTGAYATGRLTCFLFEDDFTDAL